MKAYIGKVFEWRVGRFAYRGEGLSFQVRRHSGSACILLPYIKATPAVIGHVLPSIHVCHTKCASAPKCQSDDWNKKEKLLGHVSLKKKKSAEVKKKHLSAEKNSRTILYPCFIFISIWVPKSSIRQAVVWWGVILTCKIHITTAHAHAHTH